MFNNWRYFPRLFPYIRPYAFRAVLLVVLTALSAGVALFEPWPMALLIDSVLGKTSYPDFLSFLARWDATGQILFVVLMGFGFRVLLSAMEVAMRAVDTRLELSTVFDFRSDLFSHIQKLSFQYHDHGAAGRFIYQINLFAHAVGSILTTLLPMAQALLTLGGMFFITYRLNAQMAIAATVAIPFVSVLTNLYGSRIEPLIVRVRDLEGDSMTIIHEKLSMHRVVVAFCRERYELGLFRRQAQIGVDARVRLTILETLYSLAVQSCTAGGTALVLFIGARAVLNQTLTVGQLLVILSYVAAVYQPVEQLSHSLAGLQQQFVQLKIVMGVLDAKIDVQEKPDAVDLVKPRGRIEFDNVSFHYESRERTLEELNLVIEPGEFVAVVGPTGAGKSTLVSLVPRFFDPQEGRILIDGHDVRDITLASARGNIGLVMQEPMLFMDTLMENIRYGRLEASDEEVMASAVAANCHDFIMALPDGYNTKVGERGARLSGGERQRIAVARTFLKDAPILILDEPTSSIDSRTEIDHHRSA